MKKREKIQKEASDAVVLNRFNGILFVSPRVGKCKITIDALNTVDKTIKVLIMAPQLSILEDWKREIVTWNLVDNIEVEYVWSNSLKKNKDTYNLIIADECHSYNLKVLAELRKRQIKGSRILGLTGTLTQQDEFNLGNILSLVPFYTYTFAQAIKDKIIADYEIICVGVPLDDTDKYVLAGTEAAPFNQTELEAYSYWDSRYKRDVVQGKYKNLRFLMSKRTGIIYNSRSKVAATKAIVDDPKMGRCLVFTGRQEIANQIGEGCYHSNANKSSLEDFKNGTINKLSVISMISMGITIPNLKVAVFNQLKSVESLCIQQTMRAMNLQGKSKAKIYIVYLKGTQDEIWMASALQGFEKTKIKWI
jgi:superfamily II DNA or RNA helicase